MGWLSWISKQNNITIQHAWHDLGEKRLHDARVWADGYHEDTNTVYSYNGCFYHG